MAKQNKTRYALLGMLSIEPASGYDIKKKMACSTDYFWAEGDGAIYPILKLLLEEDKVTCEVVTSENGKVRKIYTITADGEDELKDWLARPYQAVQHRDELMLKIFFGWNVDPEVTIKHLQRCLVEKQDFLDKYAELDKPYGGNSGNKNSGSKNRADYQRITLEAGMEITKASMEWAKKTIKRLENVTKNNP